MAENIKEYYGETWIQTQKQIFCSSSSTKWYLASTHHHLEQFVYREHAKKHTETFPMGSSAVLKSTNMDDTMDSVTDDKTGIKLCHQLSKLWQSAGTYTRKWL